MSETEAEHVFYHEYAHLKGRDLWANALVEVACVLHWFNPLARLTLRRWLADREGLRDAQALRWLGDQASQRLAYGQTLLAMARSLSRPGWSPSLAAHAASEKNIHRRIAMITNDSGTRAPSWRTRTIASIGLATAAVCFAAATHPPKTPEPTPVSSPSGAVETVAEGPTTSSPQETTPSNGTQPLPSGNQPQELAGQPITDNTLDKMIKTAGLSSDASVSASERPPEAGGAQALEAEVRELRRTVQVLTEVVKNSQALQGAPRRYTMKKGDTFFSIAQKFGVTVDDLTHENGLSPTDSVANGTSLNIPSTRKDDSLSSGPAPSQRIDGDPSVQASRSTMKSSTPKTSAVPAERSNHYLKSLDMLEAEKLSVEDQISELLLTCGENHPAVLSAQIQLKSIDRARTHLRDKEEVRQRKEAERAKEIAERRRTLIDKIADTDSALLDIETAKVAPNVAPEDRSKLNADGLNLKKQLMHLKIDLEELSQAKSTQ